MSAPKVHISAAYTSPGPKYKLPTLTGSKKHDIYSVYAKAPSYTFGNRHKDLFVSISPGPKLTHTPVYRNGIEISPKYSIKSRMKKKDPDKTPSPIVYNLEKSKSHVYKNAPKVSISLPLRPRPGDTTPAPKYDLPSMMCEPKQSNKIRAPAYTIMPKSNFMPKSNNPGPAVYNVTSPDIYLTKQPGYSFRFRHKPHKIEKIPGPGTHSPERVWVHKKKEPQFSFGIRHSMYITPLVARPSD